MSMPITTHIGHDALSALVQYCDERGLKKFLLVSDRNTHQALGHSVERAFIDHGYDVIVAVLKGDEVIADEDALIQVFLKVDQKERTFLGVGSGTITDITRFVSHRTHASFISLPTAPSVDGFTSIGAPLVIRRLKQTFLCQPPTAIFADLPTLCAAPPPMIAAGFGDMIGKLLSTSDWKIGHILWDEPFDEDIWERSRRAAMLCAEHAEEIGRGTEEGVRILMGSLIESGYCMLDFGNTSPASGAEHHLSHYWEMKLLDEKRPAILHGAKVGVASVITSGWYQAIQKLSRDQVFQKLKDRQVPDPQKAESEVREGFGGIADMLIAEQAGFIRMRPDSFYMLKMRIVDCWDEILEIAAQVPSPQQLTDWLQKAQAPVSPQALALDEEEVARAIRFNHYIRRRFTISKLMHFLGMLETGAQ
jgi:glycerol-1-phosphate dehydrogenase [NAD(P)+]